MAFGNQLIDPGNIPLPQVYVSGVGWVALQGSTFTQTDTQSNTATAASFELNRVNGGLLSPKNPVIVEQSIQNWLRLGQMFAATTTRLATATNPTLTMGASLFNPTSAKNFLILSARIMQNATQTSMQLNMTTVDPLFATALTPVNLSAGSATVSAASISGPANNATASVTISGTAFDWTMLGASTLTYEFIPPNMGILLPASAANGVAMFQTIGAAGGLYAFSFRWVEFS